MKKRIKIVLACELAVVIVIGIIALTMVWFEDGFVNFLSGNEHYMAQSSFMRWISRESDPYGGSASWHAAYLLITALLHFYKLIIIGIFVFMIIRSIIVYRKNRNRILTAVLLAITFLFFVVQFRIPLIDYQQHDGCPFSWYGDDTLYSLNEPSLFYYNVGMDETIYRLVQTSRGHPMAIRVHLNHAERTGVMHITFFGAEADDFVWDSGVFVSGPEPMRMEKTFVLDSQQYRELNRLFSRRKFWRTPSPFGHMGHGGFTWKVEGVNADKYHVVERWTPTYGNVARLGNSFIDYAFSLFDEAGYRQKYVIWR